MERWEIEDMLMNIRNAADSHACVARSCSGFNDRDGDFYHSGMCSAFDVVATYLQSWLAELDSASGRLGYVFSAR